MASIFQLYNFNVKIPWISTVRLSTAVNEWIRQLFLKLRTTAIYFVCSETDVWDYFVSFGRWIGHTKTDTKRFVCCISWENLHKTAVVRNQQLHIFQVLWHIFSSFHIHICRKYTNLKLERNSSIKVKWNVRVQFRIRKIFGLAKNEGVSSHWYFVVVLSSQRFD